jgi:hypothetical protein
MAPSPRCNGRRPLGIAEPGGVVGQQPGCFEIDTHLRHVPAHLRMIRQGLRESMRRPARTVSMMVLCAATGCPRTPPCRSPSADLDEVRRRPGGEDLDVRSGVRAEHHLLPDRHVFGGRARAEVFEPEVVTDDAYEGTGGAR